MGIVPMYKCASCAKTFGNVSDAAACCSNDPAYRPKGGELMGDQGQEDEQAETQRNRYLEEQSRSF